MSVTAISGWGREYLGKAPGKVADLDPVQHFAIQQTLVRYAYALDQHDLAALEAGHAGDPAPGQVPAAGRVRHSDDGVRRSGAALQVRVEMFMAGVAALAAARLAQPAS